MESMSQPGLCPSTSESDWLGAAVIHVSWHKMRHLNVTSRLERSHGRPKGGELTGALSGVHERHMYRPGDMPHPVLKPETMYALALHFELLFGARNGDTIFPSPVATSPRPGIVEMSSGYDLTPKQDK